MLLIYSSSRVSSRVGSAKLAPTYSKLHNVALGRGIRTYTYRSPRPLPEKARKAVACLGGSASS